MVRAGRDADGYAAVGAGFRRVVDGVLDGGVDVRAVGLCAGLDEDCNVLRVGREWGCEGGEEDSAQNVSHAASRAARFISQQVIAGTLDRVRWAIFGQKGMRKIAGQ